MPRREARPTVALARSRRCRRYWNRVPVERLLACTPLRLEVVGAGVAGRSSEVEAAEALCGCSPQRFPVQEHVRTEREVLLQAGRPGHDQAILEGEDHEPANRRAALAHEENPRAAAKGFEDGAEKPEPVNRRSEIAHPNDERLVKRREVLCSPAFDREPGTLGLPDLVSHTFVQLSPETVGVRRNRESHVDFGLCRWHVDIDRRRASELDGPCPERTGLGDEMFDEDPGQGGRRAARTAAVEKWHRRHNRAEERPAHDERGEDARAAPVVLGAQVERLVAVCLLNEHEPFRRVREVRLTGIVKDAPPRAVRIRKCANHDQTAAMDMRSPTASKTLIRQPWAWRNSRAVPNRNSLSRHVSLSTAFSRPT